MNSFEIRDNKLIHYYGKDETITIPDVEVIGAEAFKGNNTLCSIIIPNTVKNLEDRCFMCCYQLEEIILPGTIQTVGADLFSNCSNLRSIEINANIEEIPNGFCFACGKLEYISLPDGIKRIGDYAFQWANIKEVVFPNNIQFIGSSAFSHCQSLTRVSIPETIKKIDSFAFAYCKYLATSQFTLPQTCETASNAFVGTCVKGYHTVSIMVKYEDDQFKVTETINYEFKDDESVEDSLFDIIDDAVCGEFDELIDNALASYNPGPRDLFNLCNVEEELYFAARSYLKSITSDKKISLQLIDGSEQEYFYSLYEYLSKKIEGREGCETADCDIGAVVESSLLDFESKGVWHFAFLNEEGSLVPASLEAKPMYDSENGTWWMDTKRYKPVLWFGVDGTIPDSPWIISEDIDQDDLDFWLYPDGDSILNRIIDDCNDSFLIWYFAECGRDCIDVEAILKICPLKIEETDTGESIRLKINELFLSDI